MESKSVFIPRDEKKDVFPVSISGKDEISIPRINESDSATTSIGWLLVELASSVLEQENNKSKSEKWKINLD
ncbi:MAG TPA: hypothetical protein PK281_03390 [Flavobacteriales bacterium]|nr:hypothetical protein [Flavobacteriales bacterium]